MSLVLSRRSCRVCQFMVFNISDTLLVLWCLLHVYLAARRCTFSSELMFSFVWGSQTVQQYSNLGLIRVWYARSFIVCDCTFRFLLIKHNDLFALAAVCWMCIARNDRWFAHLHIQNGGSKRIWILTYSWTGNFLLAWAGQFAGIKNQTMHRFEQYLKILQLYHENSRFPPSFKFEA